MLSIPSRCTLMRSGTDLAFASLLGPSAQHLLGTDSEGKDILIQMINGGQSIIIVGATAGLFVASIVLVALTLWFMSVRDVGSALIRIRPRQRPATVGPSPNPLLRLPVLALVYEQRLGVLAWGIGCGFFAFYLASISRQMLDLIQGSSGFRVYLTLIGHGNPYVALTGYLWFGIFLALLSVFAITQVARWSSDDNEGRLEMVLSAPVSRTRVVLERAAALVLRMAGVIAITSLAFELGAATANVTIEAGERPGAGAVVQDPVAGDAQVQHAKLLLKEPSGARMTKSP